MLLRESVVELEPGSVLAGRYQIRRVLGKGATGVVLEADDRVSRSLVALKVFKPEIASDDRWHEVVGSELRHARQIMHPNVCRVFDAGEADGYRFLSMEYASGGSLRQRLKDARSGRSFHERVADARAVVNGLAAIHAAGMIHRDVKPDNVLRMEDERLVLTDFGLAVAPGQTTFMSGYSGAVGTPSYMAPEVALGGDASMASDVFSLGVILHEIFFDRRPTWDTTKRGRFLQSPIDRHSPRRLRHMASLCGQCLEELAPRRPTTAIEVRRMFDRALLGRYGTVLGAFHAGRWGVTVGALLTLIAFVSLFVLSRPSDTARRLRTVGVSKPLSQSGHLLAMVPGDFRCLSPSRDGRWVHVIWGSPERAEQIDVKTGEVAPWNILPETFRSGCPVLSPDGRRLAYTVGNESPQIMLSDLRDGSPATFVTGGSNPQWLPSGQELIYTVDSRRLALISPGSRAYLVPEASAPNETFMAASVDSAATRLTVVYDGPGYVNSLVVVHKLPSLEILHKYRTPSWAAAATYAGRDEEIYLTAAAPQGSSLFSIKSNELVRRAHYDGWDIFRAVGDPSGVWLGVVQARASLVAMTETGQREIARARNFDQLDFSPDGHVAFQESLDDGRTVIGLYDSSKQRYLRLSAGRVDMEPLFDPSGRQLAYIEWAAQRVHLCEVDEPHRCRVIFAGEEAWWLAGFSPSGKRLALYSGTPSGTRLRVVDVSDASSIDLGYTSVRRCRARWDSEQRFWIFREGERPYWAEMSIESKSPTGRSEFATETHLGGCPPKRESAGTFRAVRTVHKSIAALWRYQSE